VENTLAFLCLLLITGLSYALGRRLAGRFQASASVEIVVLVWLGLFLVCTFNQCYSLARERTALIHQESDAIAQAYRMLQRLPDAQRTQMRMLLISYLDAKLRGHPGLSPKAHEDLSQEIVGLQSQLYGQGVALTERHALSEAQGQLLGQQINQMISMHYRTEYALREGMSPPVMLLLLLLASAGSFVTGLAGRDLLQSLLLSCLIWSTSWVLLDLNEAEGGLIRADKSNLRDLVNILHQQEQF